MDEDIDDEELARILKEEGMSRDKGDSLWGGGDEDEDEDDGMDEDEEAGGLGEIVEEIENDDDLTEAERAKAAFGIASIFNTAAEEASAAPSDGKKKKGGVQEPYDPSLRGQTTTGRIKGGGGEDKDKDAPPPLLSRPKMS